MIAYLRQLIMRLRWKIGTNADYCCDNCGRGGWAGYSVPDEVWRKVFPDGSGQLCLDCLTLELQKQDAWTGWFCYPQQWSVERKDDYLHILGEHDRLHNLFRSIAFNMEEFDGVRFQNGFYEKPKEDES